MKNHPKISIFLWSYNHAKYLRESIESILNQTFSDFELFILDDASTDESWEIINSYSDPRIQAFRNETNQLGEFPEVFQQVATGEYIAINHSDDLWEPEKLSKQVAFLDAHPEIGAVFTNAMIIKENSESFEDKTHFYYSIFSQPNRCRHEWLNFFFYHGNALCHPSVLIRKVCYEQCGPYRYGLFQLPDLDMWIRLCLKYEIYILPDKLVRFRVHNNEANVSGNAPEKRIRSMYEFYKTLENYKKIKNFNDLVKVFPYAEKFNRKEETDLHFALAMVALEEKPTILTQLFGLDILFELIADPVRSVNIKSLYNFDHMNFIDLTGKHDIFSREQIPNLRHMITEREEQLRALDQAITERDGRIAGFHHIIAERDEQLRVLNQTITNSNRLSRLTTAIHLMRLFLSNPLLTIKLLNPRVLKKAFRFFIKNEGDGSQILHNYRVVFSSPYSEKSIMEHTVLKELASQYGLSVFRKEDASAKIKPEEIKCWIENLRQVANSLPEKKPSISIIIPVYNQIRFTLACIHSILANAGRTDFEIIIADDASTDETSIAFDGNMRRVRYLRNKNNLGFLNNCNAAAENAQGRFFVFLNNDTIVLPGWLDELIRPLEENSSVGLVGSKLIYPDGRLQEAGGIIFNDASGWNFGRFDNPGKPKYNFLRDADYCSGASIAISSELWRRTGGFDTRFTPAYYEDTDLAFQVRAAGNRVVYQPLSEVVHFEGVSHGTSEDEAIKQHQPKNKLKFFAKWNDVLTSFGICDPESLPVDRYCKGRMLVVDAVTPTPDKDSGSVDTYNYLKIFKDLGYHVTFIPENLQYCGNYTRDLRRIGVECVYIPWFTSLAKAVEQYAPLADFVLLYRTPVADPLVDIIRKYAPEAKLLFDTVDLHYLREEREAQIHRSSFHLSLAKSMKEMELGVIKKVDATILLNEYEMKLVNELIPKARLFHIPIVRDIPGLSAVQWEDRRDIVFIGGYQHPPNIDAVLFFVSVVWPHIRASGFSGRFIIAGSQMPDEITALAADDIIIRGYVPDLSELFGSCRFSIAPLRYGAGMKGKVISSLCHGVPCIATSMATEGTGLIAGEHILVEDDPKEMASLIQQAYNDKLLWEKLSEAGLSYCIKNCSIDAVKSKLSLMLSEISKT